MKTMRRLAVVGAVMIAMGCGAAVAQDAGDRSGQNVLAGSVAASSSIDDVAAFVRELMQQGPRREPAVPDNGAAPAAPGAPTTKDFMSGGQSSRDGRTAAPPTSAAAGGEGSRQGSNIVGEAVSTAQYPINPGGMGQRGQRAAAVAGCERCVQI